MDNFAMESFYDFINKYNALETVKSLIVLAERIPEHRANIFAQQFKGNHFPFINTNRYKPHWQLYENYYEGDNNYKLDILFGKSSVSVTFWNPPKCNQAGLDALTAKLSSIGWQNQFDMHDRFKYIKHFRFSDQIKTLSDIDKAVVDFVRDFMDKLSEQIKLKNFLKTD